MRRVAGWEEFASEAQLALERQQVVMRRDQDGKSLKQFLNRVLGMPCRVQETLFELLATHVEALEAADRRDGLLNQGVVCPGPAFHKRSHLLFSNSRAWT